jgi:hypothetical protein
MNMKRNAAVLALLVLAQLGVEYALDLSPGRLVRWSWEVRLAVVIAVFVALGAVAYLLFTGEMWARVGWVALATALPPLIAEALYWSDAAYPYLNYLVAIVLAAIASLGALGARALKKRVVENPP